MRVVATTSKEAYASIQDRLGEKQQLVLGALEELNVGCNDEIARQLGWPINRVTGRVNEIRKMGRIELAFIKPGTYGKNVKYWRVAPPESHFQVSIFDREEC